MIHHRPHNKVTAENLLPILVEVQRMIALRRVSSIISFLVEKGLGKTTARWVVHAMLDLKVITWRGEAAQGLIFFNKVDWVEAPPTLQLAELIIQQKNENIKKYVEERDTNKIVKEVKKKQEKVLAEKEEEKEEEKAASDVQEGVYVPVSDANTFIATPPVEYSVPDITKFSEQELVDELRNRGCEVVCRKTVVVEL
jgi:hypothetical protein